MTGERRIGKVVKGGSVSLSELLSRYLLLGTVQNRSIHNSYEGWNFNSGNYLFTNDTK